MLEHYAAILPKRMPQKQQIESFILTPQELSGVANGNEPRLPLSSSHWQRHVGIADVWVHCGSQVKSG